MLESSLAAALAEARVPAMARLGLSIGTAMGDFDVGESPPLSPHLLTLSLAERFGLSGPLSTSSVTCASALYALERAEIELALGRADAMALAGSDRLGPFNRAGFEALGVLGTRGLVLGEAGGAAVLERVAGARARGAPIRALLLGRSLRADNLHLTAVEEGGRAMEVAIRAALDEAALGIGDVARIVWTAHANPAYGRMYEQVLGRLFGEPGPPRSTWEDRFGHVMAASGVVALVHAAWLFARGERGPVLSLVVGFGGQNGALVLAPDGAA